MRQVVILICNSSSIDIGMPGSKRFLRAVFLLDETIENPPEKCLCDMRLGHLMHCSINREHLMGLSLATICNQFVADVASRKYTFGNFIDSDFTSSLFT